MIEEIIVGYFSIASETLEQLLRELQSLDTEALEEVLAKYLNHSEKTIAALRHGCDGRAYTYGEIGDILNLTGGRVRKVHEKALTKLTKDVVLDELRKRIEQCQRGD